MKDFRFDFALIRKLLVRQSEIVLISPARALMISYHQEASPMERMIFIVLFLAMKSKKLFPTYYKSGWKSFLKELCSYIHILHRHWLKYFVKFASYRIIFSNVLASLRVVVIWLFRKYWKVVLTILYFLHFWPHQGQNHFNQGPKLWNQKHFWPFWDQSKNKNTFWPS